MAKQKLISVFTIAAILFARCNLGLSHGKAYVGANLLVDLIAAAFCLCLFIKDKETTKKAIFNLATIWLVAFSILVFIYGYFKIGTVYPDMYSRQFQLLTIIPAILIMVILFYAKDDLLDIINWSGNIVIVTTLITSLITDPVWAGFINGIVDTRPGATLAGTAVDTGNLVWILAVPALYQIIINKQYKRQLFFVVLSVLQIIIGASKSSALPIVLVLAILLIGSAEDKKTLRRNIIILLVLGVVGTVAIMLPPLYGIIGERIVELVKGVGDKNPDLHTSTGQRMAVIIAFQEHFSEHPIFGHGFYAFKSMPYSKVEQFHGGFRHIHTHANYLELLFSFGIFGFIMYYWFPVYLVIKSFFAKNKMVKLIVLSYMASFAVMDLGIDMFYLYLTPYYTYLVSYVLLKRKEDTVIIG